MPIPEIDCTSAANGCCINPVGAAGVDLLHGHFSESAPCGLGNKDNSDLPLAHDRGGGGKCHSSHTFFERDLLPKGEP